MGFRKTQINYHENINWTKGYLYNSLIGWLIITDITLHTTALTSFVFFFWLAFCACCF